MNEYDAILIVSFGGPEGLDDVIPFLENVLRGRNVPRERMLQVAHHYELFDGVSPINQQNRELIEALRSELAQNGPQLPIYWGNRNWHPLLTDSLKQMAKDGVKHALAFVTAAYSSFSSCRQYRQNIMDAQSAVGPRAPQVDKLRSFYNHPLFIEANVAHIESAFSKLNRLRNDTAAQPHLIFTAHSIPQSMADNSDYADQLSETARLIGESVGTENWQLVYQSRSGSPQQPWLGPDICDHLRELKNTGINDVIVAPIGFVSDHMEVIYDLDVEARKVANEIGLHMVRASTAGTHPAFVKMIRELIIERTDGATPRALGTRGPSPNECRIDCCLMA